MRRAVNWLSGEAPPRQTSLADNRIETSPPDPNEPTSEQAGRTGDDDLILATARANYLRNADYGRDLPDLGNRWGVFKQEMSRRIMNFASAVEAIEFGQLRCSFDHRGPIDESALAEINFARLLLACEYPRYAHLIDSFSDTPASAPGTYLPFTTPSGTSVLASKILYFHAFYILTVLTQIGKVTSVCEIGGGYGNPAMLWMNCPIGPIHRYCIIDLPESLFFAEVFLRSALPDVEISYLQDADELARDKGKRAILLVPIQHHRATSQMPFDVVVNTGSLGEMPDPWVAFWATWLDHQRATHFYSHNYFANPVDQLFEGRATFAPRVTEAWEVKYVRAMNPVMFFQSAGRRAAEIVFSRANSPADHGELGCSLRGLNAVQLSLENYVTFAYKAASNSRSTLNDTAELMKKVERDFGYSPVELLYLARQVESNENFRLMNAALREYVTNLRQSLQRRFESAYPRGTYSS